MDYNADKPYATHFEYVADQRASMVSIKKQAMLYMDYLYHGWCAPQKVDFLIDLILKSKPKVIVEIGVWGGKSLVTMAYALKCNGEGMIYGIDPWDNEASAEGILHEGSKYFWQTVDHLSIYGGLVYWLQQFELQKQVELVVATSEEAPPIYDIDILHIDGNHSEAASFLDVEKWVPWVKKGGYIIFDDMTWCENEIYTTRKAVEWLDAHCFKLAEFTDLSLWGVWVKL